MVLPSSKKERYTYADYLQWPDDERWELFEGVPYSMSPGPSRIHQEVTVELTRQISNFLLDQDCKVYVAPFDVRLPEQDEADESVQTVVQPDIVVVCDESKLDEQGCRGAPDFVIEVLSPGTAARDLLHKSALYEKHGVREYWAVHPVDHIVYIQLLREDSTFGERELREGRGELQVHTLPGLSIELNRVFGIKDAPT